MENGTKILLDFNKTIYLFDVYGALLSERSQEILNLYLNEDLGLTEIAELLDITRQAVYASINSSEEKLNNYEAELKIYAHDMDLKASLKNLRKLIVKEDKEGALKEIGRAHV